MGGDHKCPVCQATFTRPQHVARHMRSHTGDRPYKCQHCGDQFARSDLLSRHVNKCHANEKPPPTTGNTRRKGSASASRAITSKQACDQCVQSSLPCDGCNPCAKCVQRKCRCTFVKFHRQTAPAGPGHDPRPSSASARLPGYPTTEDFLLGAPPLGVGPTMPENLYAQQFSFHPIYTDTQDFSIPRVASDTSDFAQRFRAQAELLRRTSLDNSGNVGQPLYNDPSWLGWHQQNASEPNFSQSNVHNASLETRCLPDDTRQFTMDKDVQETLSRHVMDQRDQQYPGQPLRSPQFSLGGADAFQKSRRGSLDFSSDSSHPSSATSSNVHLPLDVPPVHMSYHDVPSQNPYPSVMNQPSHHPQPGEGGFSSAFGLMSLDDPNVLAGLAHDGVPYFSTNMNMYPGDPNATPMPTKQGITNQRTDNFGPSTSSLREAETRELREFWKTYMRTPLSGPGPALDVNAQAGTHQRRPSTPSSAHRRVRVNSLPSAKTPTAEGVKPHYPNGTNNASGANATSSIRTTLHGNVDDLRSYEAAVLARKTPTLHLAPRRRGNASASPQFSGGNVTGTAPQGGVKIDVNRPSSASSVSSLADAFGKSDGQARGALDGGRENWGTRRSPPSRESSLSLTGEESASDVDAFRPSFKRLPSQTLGPEKSKRALLSHQGSESGGVGTLMDGGSREGGGRHDGNNAGGMGKGLSEQCQAVPLTDRHRRLSPPGAALMAPVLSTGQGMVES